MRPPVRRRLDCCAWLTTRMGKSSVGRLCRVSWRTVGRACERVVATELDPDRLNGLFRIGVDEISWHKHHKYLTLVVDHDRGKVIWGAKGMDAATLDAFFDELGPERRPRSPRCRWIWGRPSSRACEPKAMLPRPSSALIPSIWSSWWARPSTRYAGSCGTSFAGCPTIRGSLQGFPVGAAQEPRGPHRGPGRPARPHPPRPGRHLAGV